MKNIIIALTLAFFFQNVLSQIYIPMDTSSVEIRKEAAKLYQFNEKLFNKKLNTEYKSGELAFIKKRYEYINKSFNEDILKGEYIFDERFDRMITEIVTEIKATNTFIPSDLKFYVSRDITLNASSFGNKNFVIHLGAFYYLQNEDQLAAVISHETAHLVLNHTIKWMINQYNLTKSSDFKDEVSEIKNDKNNQGNKAYIKYKNIVYQDGRLSKKHELEADSLGYEIYRKTKFNKTGYINNFRLKEIYDTIRPVGLNISTYKKVFNLQQQPFNEKWLQKEDFTKYNYTNFKERYNEDSIDSHPETVFRIAELKRKFSELRDEEESVVASQQFSDLQKIAKFEQTSCLMFQEEYGLGVYFCLLRIQENDHIEFYNERLGEFFKKIVNARKQYTLNRYLERIEPKNQSESYQQFLSFMWNLNLTELKNIADYYTKKGSI
jgi:Zn-dependent protease with chaperone function